MYIQKLSLEPNFELVSAFTKKIINDIGWINGGNQISLKKREGDFEPFLDGVGSLFNRETKQNIAQEKDFSNWCIDKNHPIYQSVEQLENAYSFKSGRVRIMRLLPKTGLSVHSDSEVRYHLVLKTNQKSYFCWNKPESTESLEVKAVCYHIPKDAHWYYADTRLTHWVYNGGETERIHIVVCAT